MPTSTENTNIPTGWVETTLGDHILTLAMGPFGSNLKVEMFTDNGVPIIKGGNLFGLYVKGDFTYVSEEKADSLGRSVAYPGDFIVTHRGTLGQVSLVPDNSFSRYVTSQSQLRFAVNKDCIDSKYLLYFLKSPSGQYELLKNASQVGVPAIATPTKAVKEINLLLPPFPEQRAIASVLSAFDDKIELLREENKTLEAIGQTMFAEWFGKYSPERLEELPEGWRVGKLSEIAEFLNGLALQKFPPENEYDYLPVIKIRELKAGITDQTNRASVNLDPKYVVDNGDVLFSWSGSLEVVIWYHGKGALNQHLFKVSSDKYPKWFYYFWTLHHLSEFREIASNKATTMGHIQRHHLDQAEVILPDEQSLRAFDEQMSPILGKLSNNNLQIQSLSKTRDELLPRLMSGEVRV